MPWCLLVLFALLPALALADDHAGSWSKPVNDLRGRLVIPADQDRKGDPFVHVYLELRNFLDVAGGQEIRFTKNTFAMQVSDESGKLLPPDDGPYSGISVLPHMLVMPYDSTLRFLVNGHGLGVAPGTRQVIDFDSSSWVIPTADRHTYYLSGTFTVEQKSGDEPITDWHGVLVLPRVAIPK
jgi:hypothetical protein